MKTITFGTIEAASEFTELLSGDYIQSNTKVSFDEAEVKSVTATEIKGGYRYTAIMKSGAKKILRKKATRLYENAFLFSGTPASGSKDELVNSFSYGKNPSSNNYGMTILGTYPVTLSA